MNSESLFHYRRIEEMSRKADIDYWQQQGTTAIVNAAWELVEEYYRL